jgi:methanethiol S-methyltransferase
LGTKFIHRQGWPENYRLPWSVQIGGACANLVFGLIPSLVLFFLWVERNCPHLGFDIGMSSLGARCLWNVFLFLGFGALHSGLAQKRAQSWIQAFLPPQLIRTFYLIVTGLSLAGVMGAWQPTEVWLWSVRGLPSEWAMFLRVLEFMTFWTCMLKAGHLLTRFGALEFLGFRQLGKSLQELHRTEGTPKLVISGLYRWVRHPVYSLTLGAFFLTPDMTLDRFLIFGGTCLYLAFGIPLEERKLVRQFGFSYENYRKSTSALFPFNLNI